MISWLLLFLEVQLFVTIISFPFMLWWGLPFSLLTIVGNLIFQPFIIGILILSAIIFVTESIGISNAFCVMMFEYLSDLWIKIADYAPVSVLVAIPCPSMFVLGIIPCVALAFVHLRRPPLVLRVVGLSFLVGGIMVICFWCRPTLLGMNIMYSSNRYVRLLYVNGNSFLVLNDLGNARTRVDRWVDYVLLPTLIKCIGSSGIDDLVIVEQSSAGCKLASYLIAKGLVRRIVVGKDQHFHKRWEQLRLSAADKEIAWWELQTSHILYDGCHGVISIEYHQADQSVSVSKGVCLTLKELVKITPLNY
jgi:hypothetical protein